jgi:hypothetical protein
MTRLESYLNKYLKVNTSIYDKYKLFGYDDQDTFIDDFDFLAYNVYMTILYENNEEEIDQLEFKEQLLEKFNDKCIISGSECELDICQLVKHPNNTHYLLSNGIILKENLHTTFNKYLWSINPDTLKVEIKDDLNIGEIKNYENTIIRIKVNNEMYLNLLNHYNIFLANLI